MFYLIAIIAVAGGFISYFLAGDVFGAESSGRRKQRILQSQNFRNGQFQNLSETPQLAEGESMPKVMMNFLFGKKDPDLKPRKSIPSVDTDLKNLKKEDNIFIWFGHSSYFIQLNGVSFLIDPVFSKFGSPVQLFNKAFPGADFYTAESMPEIDYLVITHDHYDHLDYPTVKDLRPKIKQVILPLGVGAHFEKWGYAEEQILEEDWGGSFVLKNNLHITFTPARHFSGRKFKRNNTLWTSYVLESNDLKLYLGGDSGYDSHFKMIGEKYGPFDFAVMENGQYNEAWKYIHTLPADVLQASSDLNVKQVIPVHSGKFALALHPWAEPLQKISSGAKEKNLSVLTPKIGEILYLDQENKNFEKWWE
ncbi:MBL fold metallo-hydrolase [Chryseobacterium sp. Leaf404]|uniref:MBL fold metallo-hydrolase n=1 Tax=unclassified Chryseobacterium TaxID=2593645 RepID=UPI0006FB2920|nr:MULTISPECIES: MBL fold metallo-hydrolase [unclassified Chryseobacterium]KQT17535.1 MBL fold metallo-hydrolase [Chryseobacterium sp. Leaf404]